MRYNMLIWTLVLFLLAGMVNALPYAQLSETESTYTFAEPCHTFKLDGEATLTTACIRETHEYCTAGTVCNLTVISPSGEEVVAGINMTWHPSYYQYNFSTGELDEKGTYKAMMFCQEGSPAKRGMAIFCFSVTNSGESAGDDASPSIAIMFLLISITVGVFGLSRMELSQNNILNYVLKGALTIGGMYLVTINMTIAVTLADVFGLGILNELFRYLWLINWSIYLLIFIFVFKYMLGALSLWNQKKKQKRMGLV
jgi:hypothetical protein